MSTAYDKTLFEVAHRRMRLAPLELTAADFDQLGTIDPALEAKGREALRLAQLAVVRQHTPIQTKAATSEDRSRRPVTRKQLERFADQVGTFVVELLAKNVLPLREEIAPLREEVSALKARVLELEAAAAAREEVSHADR